MTNEMIAKAKECKSAEELLALAKENGIEMTAEEAEARFAELHTEGELSDDELDAASGGGCGSSNPKVDIPEGSDIILTTKGGCTSCGSKNAHYIRIGSVAQYNCFYLSCRDCGAQFELAATYDLWNYAVLA